jgi:uncharacterized membrane protein YccC
MRAAALRSFVCTLLRDHRAQLRFCLRVTVAGLLAFALAQFSNLPLRGLWAVLTAIIVTQVSIGGSLLATTEYVVGTLAGAVYATAVAFFVPHEATLALAGVLVLSTAPLALSAALNPKFRVAPFTAVIVLLVSSEFGQSPIESGIYRVLEVVLGGLSAIVVSVTVMPEKAYGRGLQAAARILEHLAQALPELLEGFTVDLGVSVVADIQEGLSEAVAGFQSIAAETKHERLLYLAPDPDLGPLSRTLLRLRHDLVIIGRVAVAPLPESFVEHLAPILAQVGKSAGDYLRGCAAAVVARRTPPRLDAVEATLDGYVAKVAALRQEDLTRLAPIPEIEHVFVLGFAFEQLRRNLLDLQRCINECAR